MYKITKEFHFSASHQLAELHEDHPCTRLHGHNYIIKVECKNAVLNNVGFVYDYRGMDIIKKWIDDHLDHRHLNDVFDFNPTAENMAFWFYQLFKSMLWCVSAVEISETPKTNCRYEP
jgi:6-pyruvoyltetrahydropterin/6-carboxytetrahydropterin synthase